jgi:hypothetical protein
MSLINPGDLVRAGGRRTVAGRPQSKGKHLNTTKLKEEFFKILPPTIFFFVALHLVMFIHVLMLKGTAINASSSISIAVAASFSARSVLIRDMVPMIDRFPNKPLIYNVTWKILIYWLMATLIHMWSALSSSGDRPIALLLAIKSCCRKSSGAISGRFKSFYSSSSPPIAWCTN